MSNVETSIKLKFPDNLCIRRVRLLMKPLYVALVFAFALSFVLAACGSGNKAGTVTSFGQAVPAGGGMVQSYVTVKLDDDGTVVKAWLPQDDTLWSTMRKGAKSHKIRVEIKLDGKFWKFVQVLPNE